MTRMQYIGLLFAFLILSPHFNVEAHSIPSESHQLVVRSDSLIDILAIIGGGAGGTGALVTIGKWVIKLVKRFSRTSVVDQAKQVYKTCEKGVKFYQDNEDFIKQSGERLFKMGQGISQLIDGNPDAAQNEVLKSFFEKGAEMFLEPVLKTLQDVKTLEHTAEDLREKVGEIERLQENQHIQLKDLEKMLESKANGNEMDKCQSRVLKFMGNLEDGFKDYASEMKQKTVKKIKELFKQHGIEEGTAFESFEQCKDVFDIKQLQKSISDFSTGKEVDSKLIRDLKGIGEQYTNVMEDLSEGKLRKDFVDSKHIDLIHTKAEQLLKEFGAKELVQSQKALERRVEVLEGPSLNQLKDVFEEIAEKSKVVQEKSNGLVERMGEMDESMKEMTDKITTLEKDHYSDAEVVRREVQSLRDEMNEQQTKMKRMTDMIQNEGEEQAEKMRNEFHELQNDSSDPAAFDA